MAASVRQEKNSGTWSSGSSTTTSPGALTSAALAGSSIEFFVIWNGSSSSLPTVTDSASQTYVQKGSVIVDNNDGLNVVVFLLQNNASATTLTVTATWGSAQTFVGSHVKEIASVTTTSFQVTAGQNQVTPGTGTDAISSGSITPSAQPNLISAYSFCDGNGTALAAGTGYTSGIGGWDGGSGNLLLTESQRTTGTSATAATFTDTVNGGTRRYLTVATVYTESVTGSTLNASFGTYSLAGQSATLTQSGPGDQTLLAAPGVYTLLGATSQVDTSITAQTGIFTIAGQNQNLIGPAVAGAKGSLLLLGVGN